MRRLARQSPGERNTAEDEHGVQRKLRHRRVCRREPEDDMQRNRGNRAGGDRRRCADSRSGSGFQRFMSRRSGREQDQDRPALDFPGSLLKPDGGL